jgi:hypothetical protein
VVRLLVLLAGMLTTPRSRQREAAWCQADAAPGTGAAPAPPPDEYRPGDGGTQPGQPGPLPPWQSGPPGGTIQQRLVSRPGYVPRPRRVLFSRRTAVGAVAVAVVGLVFRRAITSVVLTALSAALHLMGIPVHLPSIRFAWPWQSISAGTTTNTDLGPWVLQRIEGISRPALGRANFSFFFTHKVSRSMGPLPCWYASTFYAVGHASATVVLNPGPAWWAPAAGHYRLQVLRRPHDGRPGHVTVMMILPRPQLPRSVHDIAIDNIPSRPIATQHSWTYPGLACGVLLRPQFADSVLYSQAQRIAFYKATHVAQVTAPLVHSAEAEAVQTIRDNFIQPTLNALGYALDRFTISWAVPAAPAG